MSNELPSLYDPSAVEESVYRTWTETGAFRADPADERHSFCMVIPPPNVTAALHLGHALNNTLQDVLIRFRRMQQRATLWMPGTDHAGIATQTVVEKRLLAEESKRRTDFEREEFVARVQAWKDEYEARILEQLQKMGCSCDWERTRFTMDATCAKAVRETFFRLFRDGLIYRGKRLVNWDPATQTVLADDEVEHEDIDGHFWYLRYPLTEPVTIPRGMGVSPMSSTDVSSVSCIGVSPMETIGTHPLPEDAEVIKRHGAYLPHWTQEGATYAVTFRLADALPAHVVEGWKTERQAILARAAEQNRSLTRHERVELHKLFSERIDTLLNAGQGECLLGKPKIAQAVLRALHHFDGERYDLLAWCIMPNHVHIVVRPMAGQELSKLLHSWKSFTAKEANDLLGRTGAFWQKEYYDHLIRDEEDFARAVAYVLANPEKAGLEDWPWVGMNAEHGQDAHDTHRQDADATHRHDAHDTHRQDAGATHRQDADATVITHLTVATTRPETMLGDTAVAMNPKDPRAEALVGKTVRLPLVGREIPIVADDHVVLPDPDSEDDKAKFSTGFLKVTPAHDPDDYQIGLRHDLPMINVMAPDGSISKNHGWEDWETLSENNRDVLDEWVLGKDRFEAREAIVEFFREENLLADVQPYKHSVGHSYRSHVPIEPYLSDQWYVAVKQPIPDFGFQISDWQTLREAGKLEQRDGLEYIAGTDVPVNSLAGLALAPLLTDRLKFIPDRYAENYRTWLENLRDWPISRQLWWGHQIPVWSRFGNAPAEKTEGIHYHEDQTDDGPICFACVTTDQPELEEQLETEGFTRDPDVLDTWFSSALWPFSTLGWPEQTPELAKFYPGDVLSTAREIITLWVSRMVMMGQYCCGDIPFSEVFIHAMIQDGQGRKMAKSLGNGVDPLDIIASHGADAMRYTLVSMTTQTQDVRMPVEPMTLPDGRTANSSPKFDVGRNLCNKLWNAARFVLGHLLRTPRWADIRPTDHLADAWILSRLNATVRDCTLALEGYRFNELADRLYHFFWDDFCDWYLEIAKRRIAAGDRTPRALLAHCLDVQLRLMHPILPYITETIWEKLNEAALIRGPGDTSAEDLLVLARWPLADGEAINPPAEGAFEELRDIIRQVRNVRTENNVPPSEKVDVLAEVIEGLPSTEILSENADLVRELAGVDKLELSYDEVAPPADAAAIAAGGVKLYVLGIVDVAAERARLEKQQATLAKGIKSAEGKLGNEKFLAKAPADVVEREKKRLEEMQRDLRAVEESLAALPEA